MDSRDTDTPRISMLASGKPASGKSAQGTTNSCAQDVVDYVREGMRQGVLVPGQRLAEPDLMRRLSVSRGTVREGLAQLRAEGLVEFERFRGAQIRILTRQKVIELNQIRAVIEGFAARLAAQNLDEEGAALLRSLHFDYSDVAGGYDEYNTRFHDAIASLAGNQSLNDVIAATLLDTFRTQFQRLLTRPEVSQRSHAEHGEIVAAILAKDAHKAEQLMAAHVLASSEEILRAPKYFFKE